MRYFGHRLRQAASLPCLLVLCWSLLDDANAQLAELGIRHRIDATVALEPGSYLIKPSRALKGTLTFFVRVSANSRESRYFGVLSPSFSDISISEKSPVLVPQTRIWEEDICHQRRGLPKLTVVQVRGAFEAGSDRVEVLSAVRKIGLHVPPDELTPGIKLPDGVDAIGRYYALRAHTRDSLLNVDLKLYEFACVLQG
ncbi:MAG: hypothetical protein JWQ94_1075 [Tardiphaga sp.]|nr:hypothetical protein [Tardiphaga sp.]